MTETKPKKNIHFFRKWKIEHPEPCSVSDKGGVIEIFWETRGSLFSDFDTEEELKAKLEEKGFIISKPQE